MKRRYLFILLALVWLLGACSPMANEHGQSSSDKNTAGKGAATVPAPDKSDAINNAALIGNWQVTALQGIDPLPADNPPQVQIEQGRISGSTGCNRFTGSISIASDTLEIGNVASTKMLCVDRMQLESAFLSALRKVRRTRRQDNQWLWLDASGTQLMTLTPQ